MAVTTTGPQLDRAALKHTGNWCTIYADASTGTVDTLKADELDHRHIREQLAEQGASQANLDAVLDAIGPATGEPAPVSRYVLLRDGEEVANILLPGALVGPETVLAAPVPDLVPLFRHQPQVFDFVVAEVGRDGGDVALYRLGGLKGQADHHEIEGELHDLNKVRGGGMAHSRYQRHSEELWRRNSEQVAALIDDLVAAHPVRLVILTGDLRARGLVADQVSEAARERLSVIEAHTREGGVDAAEFAALIDARVAETIAADEREILERMAVQQGQANPEAAVGMGEVVTALQQAQVDTLVFDDAALRDRSVDVLDDEPWLSLQDDGFDARILGEVSVSAALVRAALFTDAAIVRLPAAALPHHSAVAALLRWPTGPQVPSR